VSPRAATLGEALSPVAAVPSPGAKGLTLADGREVFVVRDKAGGVHAYENTCPHTGGPLDWSPDTFLTLDRTRILCATHGAEFRIADGLCLRGPCAGAHLTPLAIAVRDGQIHLAD